MDDVDEMLGDSGADGLAMGRGIVVKLRALLGGLADVMSGFSAAGVASANALAIEFGDALSLAEGVRLAHARLLSSPAGAEAVGSRNTTRLLTDLLGISRPEAQQRTQAARCLGDVEPRPEPPEPGDDMDDALLSEQREVNAAVAVAKSRAGGVTCEKLRLLRLALHDLRPGGL